MLLSLSTSLDLHFLLKNDKIFDELMSFIVLYIDIVLRSIVWLKIWLVLTRKLWSTILPFDLLIRQVHTHLFYIPNPNGNVVMMFGSWQLQLVATSYDNHGQAGYRFPWIEGESIFEQNRKKNWHHSNGRGSCFMGIQDGSYWPQGPNFIWQVSISSSFSTFLFGFEFCY